MFHPLLIISVILNEHEHKIKDKQHGDRFGFPFIIQNSSKKLKIVLHYINYTAL